MGNELIDPELWDEVSVWDTFQGARRVARFVPTFIADLRIPDDAPIRVRQTGPRGHYSLKGDPDDLLAYVVAVYPLVTE